MSTRRVFRLNSLLREVISEVINKDLHHIQGKPELLTITSVEITADLSFAKVFCSTIGSAEAKIAACAVLNAIAGQISHFASRKVRMRIFPKLRFYVDEGLEKQLRICEILEKVAPHNSDMPSDMPTDTPSE
jgi:ribosome-binding factor A